MPVCVSRISAPTEVGLRVDRSERMTSSLRGRSCGHPVMGPQSVGPKSPVPPPAGHDGRSAPRHSGDFGPLSGDQGPCPRAGSSPRVDITTSRAEPTCPRPWFTSTSSRPPSNLPAVHRLCTTPNHGAGSSTSGQVRVICTCIWTAPDASRGPMVLDARPSSVAGRHWIISVSRWPRPGG
ncbi:Uncharacterised protein [Mycobacteroides abscessus subsp. abscessus]|nr:Uncharacterised protein [Mycobacteroides abscessus subsp. abscessus]